MKSSSPILKLDISTQEVLANDSSAIAQEALQGKNQGGISPVTHATRIQNILAQKKEKALSSKQQNKTCVSYLNNVIDSHLLKALEDVSFREYCDEQRKSILDMLNVTMNTTPVEYIKTPKTKKINNKKLVYPPKTIKGKVVGLSDKEDEVIFKMDNGAKYSIPTTTFYNGVVEAKNQKISEKTST